MTLPGFLFLLLDQLKVALSKPDIGVSSLVNATRGKEWNIHFI